MKKQLFAGVAIALLAVACRKPDPVYTTTSNLNLLDRQLVSYGPRPQTKIFPAEEVITFNTEAGNKVVFPANAFVDNVGNKIIGNVEVSVTEITDISGILLSGMMTNSDQGPLSSQGEFNVIVSQNGESLNLSDDITFTIENPNADFDSTITGWNWIPAQPFTNQETGVIETINARWSQNEFDENNDCDRLIEMLKSINESDVNFETTKVWKELQKYKRFLNTSLDELTDSDNNKLVYLYHHNINGWGGPQLYCNNFNNEWGAGAGFWNNSNVLGREDSIVTTHVGAFNPDATISIQGCELILDSTLKINLDPNTIAIEFNQLNWCNIDRLISEYGGIYDCELKTDGIPKGASVKCIFEGYNGAISCALGSDNTFIADRLPDGMDVKFLVYFQDGDKIKFGNQTITAAKEMVFNESHLKRLDDIDALVEEIEKLSE